MNAKDPRQSHRRSIRLPGYDYAKRGAYVVTICTYRREPLFGRVVNGEMVLNEYGEMVRACWREIPDHFPHVALDAFVVMPNHVHGILWIVGNVGARHAVPLHDGETVPNQERFGKPVQGSIPTIIRSFKSAVTCRINALPGKPGAPVWQRNYYEHIIRTERALNAIRRYMAENPLRWHLDRYNPKATDTDPLARTLWQMVETDAHIRPNPYRRRLRRPNNNSEEQP